MASLVIEKVLMATISCLYTILFFSFCFVGEQKAAEELGMGNHIDGCAEKLSVTSGSVNGFFTFPCIRGSNCYEIV